MGLPELQHLHWPYNDLLTYQPLRGPRQPVTTPAEWEVRREEIERALLGLLGPFPVRKCPLEPVVLDEQVFDDIVRRTVEYSVQPGDRVRAYLSFPEWIGQAGGPLPVVLSLHGTAATGKDSRWDHPTTPNCSHARLLPGLGFVTLTPDGPTAGERLVPGETAFDSDPFYARTEGWSMFGKYAWEAIRAVDYMHALAAEDNRVDASRIGAIGTSLGAEWVIIGMCFDDRITCGAANNGWVPFRTDTNEAEYNVPTRWAREPGRLFSYMPNLARYYLEGVPPPLDWHEILALIAPRPLINCGAWQDVCFQDAAGIPEACQLAARVWEFLGAPEQFQYIMAEADHGHFDADLLHGWLTRWLQRPTCG
jgi:dienelactone hydrolase